MNNHQKKMIAPVVVALILIAYYLIYFGFLISLLDGLFKLVLGVLPIAFTAVIIMVLIERIKEIKEGEEDDLGQY